METLDVPVKLEKITNSAELSRSELTYFNQIFFMRKHAGRILISERF